MSTGRGMIDERFKKKFVEFGRLVFKKIAKKKFFFTPSLRDGLKCAEMILNRIYSSQITYPKQNFPRANPFSTFLETQVGRHLEFWKTDFIFVITPPRNPHTVIFIKIGKSFGLRSKKEYLKKKIFIPFKCTNLN